MGIMIASCVSANVADGDGRSERTMSQVVIEILYEIWILQGRHPFGSKRRHNKDLGFSPSVIPARYSETEVSRQKNRLLLDVFASDDDDSGLLMGVDCEMDTDDDDVVAAGLGP